MRIAVFFCILWSCATAQAQTDTGFYLEPITEPGSISLPTSVVPSPTGELYVTQYAGFVKVVLTTGEVISLPLVNLFNEVLVSGDRSLVGVTLHPDFPATPYIYLFYPVDDTPGERPETGFRGYSRLVRYTIAEDFRGVVPDSRLVLLGATPEEGIVSCYNSHSANSLLFGHDGALYVSHGDGASWAEPDPGGLYPECFDGSGIDPTQDTGSFRAQSLESLSGKVLRLDPETGLGLPDNPFWTGDGSDPASKVWAMGLRNPFRMALVPEDLDNPGRTEIVIGDVGSGLYEELNRATGGENFGWPCIEGPAPNPGFTSLTVTDGTDCSTTRPGTLTAPWAYFSHLDPQASAPAGRLAFSITGGSFYRGTQYPERFQGMLFFADFTEGWIVAGRLGPDGLIQPEEVIADAGSIVDLTYDPITESFYTVDINNESISRLRWAGDAGAPPVARGSVSEPFGELPHAVEFSDDGSLDPSGGTLSYTWSFGDGEGAEGASVSHTYTSPGSYAATLTVTAEDGRVAQSIVRVSVGVSLPTLEVIEPTEFVTGPDGRFTLEAEASDARNETLDVFWEVDLVHNAHVHPSFNRVDGPSGVIVAPSHAGPGEVAFYRARAVVIDQEGLRVERVRTVRSYDAAEIGVTPGAGAEADQPLTAIFSYPVEIGRVSLTASDAFGPLAVEVLGESGWQPARQAHTLIEGESTVQVVFASEVVRGVRVSGAPELTASITTYPRLSPDEDLTSDDGIAWDPADAGASSEGRTNRFQERGLVLAGSGSFETGDYHTARRPISGDGFVVAHLAALDGRADAFAGVAMHTGLGSDATGITIARSPDGRVRVWERRTGRTTVQNLAIDGADWFRIRQEAGRVIAEASSDSLTWVLGGEVRVDGAVPLIAGPAVAGGEQGAMAWFDSVSLGDGLVSPPGEGTFVVRELYPNPGRGQATVWVEVGTPGTYTAQVVDARGRVVMTLPGRVVSDPEVFRLSFERGGLSQGVYYLSLRNADTGDARQARFVVVR